MAFELKVSSVDPCPGFRVYPLTAKQVEVCEENPCTLFSGRPAGAGGYYHVQSIYAIKGAWRLRGGAEGRWFESHSGRHIGTLGWSFARSCLYDECGALRDCLVAKFDSCKHPFILYLKTFFGVSYCILNEKYYYIMC